MQKADFASFEKLLTELAECYDRKPPTATAVLHWFEALHSFAMHKVETEIKTWLTTKNKYPAISDIFQSLNEKAIDDREKVWEAQKEQEKRESNNFIRTSQGKKILAELKQTLFSDKPRDPKAWAYKILDRFADGEEMPYIAITNACEVLKIDPRSLANSRKDAA